ncbi:unnamed protein product [Brassica oleracea]|uniref:Uncharacterized protein n=1 Tax=Brassica oleracea TaxID=3712 RepID=A0A3P6EQY2_BRAOL|nr:unnamed protein product [Brassica oleracea]
MAKESKALSLKLEQKTLLFRLIAQYLEQRGFSKCFKKLLFEAEIENIALPDLEEVYGVFLNKSHLEAVEGKYESGDDVEKKTGIVDENASDDHETDKEEENMKEVAEVSVMEGIEKVKKEKKKKKKEPKVEVTKEERVKETDAGIEDGIKEKKKKVTESGVKVKNKKKKNKSKSMEAETLGNEEKVSKMRKTSEPEETKEQTEDNEESKHKKKEEDVAEDNVQEILVKQTADVQENAKETFMCSLTTGLNTTLIGLWFYIISISLDGADSGYGAKSQEVVGKVKRKVKAPQLWTLLYVLTDNEGVWIVDSVLRVEDTCLDFMS